MKQWHFYDKVYRRWVVLMICPYEDFKHELELNEFKDMDCIKDAKGMCVEFTPDNNGMKQYCVMIWLKEFESASLVHELTHMVMMQFEEVGIPISRENTETFAFYMEYWWTEINRVRRRFPDGRAPKYAKV